MEKIIPRWEWRTFGDQFGDAEKKIREHGEPRIRTSEEFYILSRSSNDNTKIRDELMDIKTLLRVNDFGLEQWTPILKEGFPIPINGLAIVYKAWNLPFPDFKRDEYTFEQFIEELVKPNENLVLVNVKKERHGYLIDEAIVEIAEVEANGKHIRTVAVEHADPDLVVKVVKDLGLEKYEIVNYIKALKRLEGLTY